MPASNIAADVIGLVAHVSGRAARKIRPADRLLHDLGMDGDDAAEFFDSIHETFGTDLSALNERWSTHFNDEGMMLGGGVLWVITGAAVGAVAANAASASPLWGALAAGSVILGGQLAWGRWGPPDPMIAITVFDVILAVEAGAWPKEVTTHD